MIKIVECSKDMQRYFDEMEKNIVHEYKVAEAARKKGYDPEPKVEIPKVKDMAERVEGIISVVAPQIIGSGVSNRIKELESQYGALDWRISLTIALEIAQKKFCKFKTDMEAMEIGIKTGFAYLTMGVVSSPLEGFMGITLRKNKEGKDYFALKYAGPIRSAGGTGASVSVIIADYVRKKMGFSEYDATEEETKRMSTELYDYHERITNLQYLPSTDEIEFFVKHLSVQIDGDPSEDIDVSNYKDLERIETNTIRNGVCLCLGEGLCQKAPKLWKQLSKWGADFGLEHWNFLEEFVKLQKNIKAKSKGEDKTKQEKILPDYTYIKDLPAGRPVFSHPMRHGGLRLRFGRARTSGYSAAAVSPATMYVMNDFMAVGTQLKMERPGKACTLTSCSTLEGPIVLFEDGEVTRIEKKADLKGKPQIKEILFLGDILVNYGDFLNRNHKLVPPGYCEEWWAKEVEKAAVDTFGSLDSYKLSELSGVPQHVLDQVFSDPLTTRIKAEHAIKIAKATSTPLYPYYTYHFNSLSPEKLRSVVLALSGAKLTTDEFSVSKIVLPIDKDVKRSLELMGIPHIIATNEYIVIEHEHAKAAYELFSIGKKNTEQIEKIFGENKEESALGIMKKISSVRIRDKSGIFIGTRMGRPEKAKMRQLTGSPQVLFPVGEEGGRLRSFQSALEVKKVTADFATYYCEKCDRITVFSVCDNCGRKISRVYYCEKCGYTDKEKCTIKNDEGDFIDHKKAKNMEIPIKEYFENSLKKINMNIHSYPDLIKGVRGTSNDSHIPEHLAKGILRSKHDVYVNKDGTTRYDMTQLPLTHFKPKEIGTTIERLKALGYEKDVKGNPLTDDDQVLELKPQDIVLPRSLGSHDEGADKALFRVANFMDDLLVNLYGLDPFYKLSSPDDLAGHLVLCLAPHTSAGIVARIIGFSSSQGFFAHPAIHAATRRDCFASDQIITLYDKGKNIISQVEIGTFIRSLQPDKKADSHGTLKKEVQGFQTLSFDQDSKKIVFSDIKEVSSHPPSATLEIELEDGRKLNLTEDHEVFVKGMGKTKAKDLTLADQLVIPHEFKLDQTSRHDTLDLFETLKNLPGLMCRGSGSKMKSLVGSAGGRKNFREKHDIPKSDLDNFLLRDSFPAKLASRLKIQPKLIGFKRDKVTIKVRFNLEDDFFYLVGLYVAEGFSRKKTSGKGYYQISIAATEPQIRNKIKNTMKKYFGLEPSEDHADHLTYSSRIVHHLFNDHFKLGKNAKEKNIDFFLNTKKESLASLLRGYLDGDGSVSKEELRVSFDTISERLISNMTFAFGRFGIYLRCKEYCKRPGPKVRSFYERKGRDIPSFKITKLTITSFFMGQFFSGIGFGIKRKQQVLDYVINNIKPKYNKIDAKGGFAYPKIISIKKTGKKKTYCLNVLGNHNFICNSFLVKNCDGDEACVSLLLDTLINFSRHFLPGHRGSTQDAPLVLTSLLIPSEVDDMLFDVDFNWTYPLEFYEACLEYKPAWEVKMDVMGKRLGTELQYEGFGFTHDTSNINKGVLCSSYKTLPTMQDKLTFQMELAERTRAVDESDVARLVIEKHFLKDLKGNLRKFSMQQFRCVACNEKFRRPPLAGKCTACGGRIIFTISEGSVIKYLEPSISIARKYHVPKYLLQTLELLERRIEGVFGKEKEKQEGLGKWFG